MRGIVTYQCGVQRVTNSKYSHTLGDNRLCILRRHTALNSKVKHVLCLFWRELVFHGLASFDLASLHRKINRLVPGSHVDNRELRIHGDVVLWRNISVLSEVLNRRYR